MSKSINILDQQYMNLKGMRYIEIENLSDDLQRKPPEGYKRWLDFWENEKGRRASSCEAMSCYRKVEGVGLVKKEDEDSVSEYILPLCNRHKGSKESFKAWELDLVSLDDI